MSPRASGILLHPTSLSNSYPIGDLGPSVVAFLDFMVTSGQRWWQMLPIGPTGEDASPYQALSAFAGNPLLISLDRLAEQGILGRKDIALPIAGRAGRVDYPAATRLKSQCLRMAFEHFETDRHSGRQSELDAFVRAESYWLEEFSLFLALQSSEGTSDWTQWNQELRTRQPEAIIRAQKHFADDIRFQQFVQWQFSVQWQELKAHSMAKGIWLIGDVPLYVSHQSADVWAHPELFKLDAEGNPTVVAGVPADYFSRKGQVWGVPVYRWEELQRQNYEWWIQRLRMAFTRFDANRLDHFIGFIRTYEVPAHAKTAENGQYRPVGGGAFFEAVRKALGTLRLIADDLGAITPEVTALRDKLQIPGTRVLQFEFESSLVANAVPPERLSATSVVYTGTHDNDTTAGWYRALPGAQRKVLQERLNATDGEVVWAMIHEALASKADTAILPVQDLLQLGSEARMNTPGIAKGNWQWRLESGALTLDLAQRLRCVTEATGRQMPTPKPASAQPAGISSLNTTDRARQPSDGDAKNPTDRSAPNGPGIPARWTSSAKTGVGTALSNQSRVWFTLSHGIFNEIYYPRIDQACIRDMGLIVTEGTNFFSEEKRDASHKVEWLADGVPAFKLVNTCRDGRYRIEKQIVTDPHRDTVLQQVEFHTLRGALSDYHLHVLLAPHLENHGGGNTAWVGEFEGTPVLFAQRNDCALALACSAPWTKRSAGYVGSSDGWRDLKAHNRMTWEYTRAENGNVALTAGIDLVKSHGNFVLALGFGKDPDEAARNAVASLCDGFGKAKYDYVGGWQEWAKAHAPRAKGDRSVGDLTEKSLAVLRTHESKQAPGALIASLAIPWGFSKGDKDQGGYHLVWSRDMVEAAGGLLAAGAHEDTRRVLAFLQRTQQPDGHWSQNMWLDGSPYWNGIQLDETALPILLVDLAHREKALADGDLTTFWPMMKKAAGYLARNGPVSPQDRWEEDPGYTPFTVAAEIAALLAAAEMADWNHEASTANHLREIADVWNTSIERWMYMSATDWCKKFKVEGYYVRITPKTTGTDGASLQENINVKNVTASEDTRRASHLISPDALALVRFGLRAADDPRIRDTARVIDALLKVETPTGSTWHRYNDDGYGEHKDGSPFDGTGIGRGWPLLTGERAHCELAAGRTEIANQLLATMEFFANESGLISEQVWDSPDIAERELHFGRPSGSAMPLVWAHAEYLKLRRSLHDGRLFDQPPQTVQRYLKEKAVSPRLTWRYNHKLRSLPPGKILRIELMAPAVIHWTADDWKTCQDLKTHDAGLGIHLADLPTRSLPEGMQIKFTFYWPGASHWEGKDFMVRIATWRREGSVTTETNETNAK